MSKFEQPTGVVISRMVGEDRQALSGPDGEYLIFPDQDAAIAYLKGENCSDEEIETFTFVDAYTVIPQRYNQPLCPDCDGSGELAGDYLADDGVATCERCKGKGIITQ